MARRVNSVEAKGAVRADIQEAIDERVTDDYSRFMRIEPTAWELWQTMKLERPEDFVRSGTRACFEGSLNCSGGGFMSELYYEEQWEALSRWLGWSPDEAAAEFDNHDRIDRLYRDMTTNAFFGMVKETKPKEGMRVEVQPCQVPNPERGTLAVGVDIRLCDGTRELGSHKAMLGEAHRLFDALKFNIQDGKPSAALASLAASYGDGVSYDKALSDVARAWRYAMKGESLIDEFTRGDIAEDGYYASMDSLDKRMNGDFDLKVGAIDVVDKYLDEYFELRMADPDTARLREYRQGRAAGTQLDGKARHAVPTPGKARRADIARDEEATRRQAAGIAHDGTQKARAAVR